MMFSFREPPVLEAAAGKPPPRCHSEPIRCHPERSEGSLQSAQGKLREESRPDPFLHKTERDSSLRSK